MLAFVFNTLLASALACLASSAVISQSNAPASAEQLPLSILTPKLRDALDTTVSPCDDFDQYANGGWRARYRGRDVDVFRHIRTYTDAKLIELLEVARKAAPTTKNATTRRLGNFYASCLLADTMPTVMPVTPSGKIPSTRQESCLVYTDHMLRTELGRGFVEYIIPPRNAILARQWLKTIQDAIRTEVQQLDWVADSMKQKALTALETLTLRVTLTPDSSDFSDLIFVPTAFAENRRAINQLVAERKRLETKYDTATVPKKLPPYYFGAMAFVEGKTIEVSTMLFQPPLFDINAESAANYAALGMILGHEMWHMLTPFFQWSNTDIGRARIGGLVEHYASTFGSSGWSTINEDLGDLGGVLAAYSAWQQNGRRSAPATIEGFTPEQRFFLYYARVWRSTNRNSRDSKHSGSRARINGVVMQIPAFAKAFGCREGDPMNPPASQRAKVFAITPW